MGGGINCIRGPNSFTLRESDLTWEKHLEHNAICCLSLCLRCVRVQSIVLRLQMDAASVWQEPRWQKCPHLLFWGFIIRQSCSVASKVSKSLQMTWVLSKMKLPCHIVLVGLVNFSGWRIAKKNSIAGVCLQKASEVFTWARISSSRTKETSSIISSMLNIQLPVRSEEPVKAILQATLSLRPVGLL